MLEYFYNDDESQIIRKCSFDIFNLKISGITREISTFKNECSKIASVLADQYPNLILGLTGGWQSQIILQSFLEIGFKPNIFIISLPVNLNDFDVNVAISICKEYSLSYNLIQISGKVITDDKSIEFQKMNHDHWKLATDVQIYNYYDLLILRHLTSLNQPIILGNQLNVRRDINPNKTWSLVLDEGTDFWVSRYKLINPEKIIINDFFTRTAEVLYSYLTDSNVTEILENNNNGKIALISSRKKIYGNYFKKMGRDTRTIGWNKIRGVQDIKSYYMEKKLGFQPRPIFLQVDKLLKQLEQEYSIWKFV